MYSKAFSISPRTSTFLLLAIVTNHKFLKTLQLQLQLQYYYILYGKIVWNSTCAFSFNKGLKCTCEVIKVKK